jgi:hypothetical protein
MGIIFGLTPFLLKHQEGVFRIVYKKMIPLRICWDEPEQGQLRYYVAREGDCISDRRVYRGHNHTGAIIVQIVRGKSRLLRSLRKWLRRRCVIEQIIGHLKSDDRMNRNYRKGEIGDTINAILFGCGANIRKLIADFFL